MGTDSAAATSRKKLNDIVFTMEDVREVIKHRQEQVKDQPETSAIVELKQDILTSQPVEQPKQQKVQAASIADILGFNPRVNKQTDTGDKAPSDIPQKYRKYYKMLLKLKRELKNGLNKLTKPAEPEDDPELAKFDSGFALSLLSNEQESLIEIESAIQRIYDGTYGICEATGQPIEAKRLEVVPFTRYSLAGQEEQEKRNAIHGKPINGAVFDNEQNEDVSGFADYDEE